MSPLYLYNGKLLVENNSLAGAQTCCCGSGVCCVSPRYDDRLPPSGCCIPNTTEEICERCEQFDCDGVVVNSCDDCGGTCNGPVEYYECIVFSNSNLGEVESCEICTSIGGETCLPKCDCYGPPQMGAFIGYFFNCQDCTNNGGEFCNGPFLWVDCLDEFGNTIEVTETCNECLNTGGICGENPVEIFACNDSFQQFIGTVSGDQDCINLGGVSCTNPRFDCIGPSTPSTSLVLDCDNSCDVCNGPYSGGYCGTWYPDTNCVYYTCDLGDDIVNVSNCNECDELEGTDCTGPLQTCPCPCPVCPDPDLFDWTVFVNGDCAKLGTNLETGECVCEGSVSGSASKSEGLIFFNTNGWTWGAIVNDGEDYITVSLDCYSNLAGGPAFIAVQATYLSCCDVTIGEETVKTTTQVGSTPNEVWNTCESVTPGPLSGDIGDGNCGSGSVSASITRI